MGISESAMLGKNLELILISGQCTLSVVSHRNIFRPYGLCYITTQLCNHSEEKAAIEDA